MTELQPGDQQESVYVSRGATKRGAKHKTPDCRNLSNARTVMEKPASVFPDGYLKKCSCCYGETDE